MQQAEAAAKSRSPSYRAGYLGFPPCSHQGREQRGCRATAQALRVTFPPRAKQRLCPCLFQEPSLTSPAAWIWGWQPYSSGCLGAPAAGPVFPSGFSIWPRLLGSRAVAVGTLGAGRAPQSRTSAFERSAAWAPCVFLLPFPPSRGEISPLQTQPTERDRALGPPGKCHAGPHSARQPQRCPSPPWGQRGCCQGGEILRMRFPGYLTKS